ncbi:hypothetical protein [Streptomyces sp. SID3343]|uniref:hypothetical protein n=1 Tax=Streptomyces sp. SID3343 TaxID=2690260 RepID=UPI001367B7AA|nr:hypothetical protein [Streptomyces sp. SID3343]MYW00398.1 hypothetical protein [Streptomyces sp. SID3343]
MTTPDTTTRDTKAAVDAARTLLDAGAVLPPATLTGDDVDTLTVRTYTHAVLADRPIVRLVPATLGDAEDLALGFLGLARDEDVPEVGQVRREALGFPAWALVNDPANGHHALALVRDIERLDRQAKTKPGSAKEGFEALATRLGRAVPHFLPTFHEQAARIFLKHDNTTYASAFFGKAREAERVHNLAIEEERLRAVFLEFAFAGALTAKALKEHAKALTNRLGPREAWVQFRQLAVERCTAGMPPYAGLAEDARALIRASGGDTETDERALLRELLATPAIARAPLSFWKVNRKPLAALAAAEPDTRQRLLEILPTPGGSTEAADLDGFWLDLLTEAGVVDLLVAGDTLAPGARAQWISRWATHRQRGWRPGPRCERTLSLVTRMADALRAEETPVTLFTGGGWRTGVDVDLLDLVLAERIPLTPPQDNACIGLDEWWDDSRDGRRDLAAVAADAAHAPLLHQGVGACKRHEKTAAHPVLRPVLAAWLTERAADLASATGLPAAEQAFGAINEFRDVVADVTPDVVERVRAYDASALLASTLRAGVYDELGWPALDEAAELLGAGVPGNVELDVDEAWPALVLSTKKRAIVVGPEGILLDHEPRVPKDHNSWQHTRYRYVDGQLLVAWYNKNYDWEGYWSSRPGETFLLDGDGPNSGSDSHPAVSLALPDGGRATGGRPLHAGDTKLPPRRALLTDGIAHWSLDHDRSDRKWTEYDPTTGAHGRASLPAPFAAAVADGGSLIAEACELLPLQPGLEHSPFGTDGTLLGRWVRVDGDTVTTGSVDGTTVTIPARNHRNWDNRPQDVPLGTLRLPGGAAPTVIATREHIALWAGDVHLGNCTTYKRGRGIAAGSPLVPPRSFWHALRPRDESGSIALRTLADDKVAELVAAVQADHDRAYHEYGEAKAAGRKPTLPALVRVEPIRRLLPEVTHPGLAFGVASLARDTAKLAERLRAFGKIEKKKVRALPTGPEHGGDNDLREALSGVINTGYYGFSSSSWTVLEHITSVARTLASTDRPQTWTTSTGKLGEPRFGWHPLLDLRAGVAARALSPFTPEAHRASLLLILEALATGPLGDPAGTLRRVTLCEPVEENKKQRNRKGEILRRGDRTVIFLDSQYTYNQNNHWVALDHDPSKNFEAIDGFTTHEEHRYTEPLSAARITALVRGVREHGPVPVRPESVPALVEGTGLGRAEASVLLSGPPADELDKDQRAILGLKATEAKNARAQLARLDGSARARVLAALVPAAPEDVHTLWTTGFDIAATIRAWEVEFGRVLRLPEDVAADLRGVASYGVDTVLAPESHAWIVGTSTHKLDKDGQLRASDGANVPSSSALAMTVTALAWLAYRLPYGDPLRAQLPHVLDLLRGRLADPGLVLDLDVEYSDGKPTAPRVREAAGLAEHGGADADGIVRIDDRLLLTPWYNGSEFTYVRPAGFTGADDPWFDRLIGLRGESSNGLTALRRILDPAFARLLAADGPAGLPQDPTHVVPELVAEVAKTHGIGEDAATLYLQLLALPDPTDRQVARWTGWKPARLKKARAELAATDLVVEAKRERAGRTLFLPGGWNALKSPQLPVETWKDGLYDRAYGSAVVPENPVPELFRRAWQRVQDGDAPGFEQLVTRTTRKGRR